MSSTGREQHHETDQFRRALNRTGIAALLSQLDRDHHLVATEAPFRPLHPNLSWGRVLLTKESSSLALQLLDRNDEGDAELAARILTALLAVQDVRPGSPTFGLWPWHAGDDPGVMDPPDWNWADFIGSMLARIVHDHLTLLPPAVVEGARTALSNAARCVLSRPVNLAYTNIAAMGAWVTLAAHELSGHDLPGEPRERLRLFHEEVTRTQTFAEFNTPNYWFVTLEAMTLIKQCTTDTTAHAMADDVIDVLWRHWLARWHSGLRQVGGPVSRTYDSDLINNRPTCVALQLASDCRLQLYDVDDLPAVGRLGEQAYVDYRATPEVIDELCGPPLPGTVVETFTPDGVVHAERTGLPAVGTTWRDTHVIIGSLNQCDTFNERRPLLGWFDSSGWFDSLGWFESGDPTHAGRVEARLFREGEPFAAGNLSTVQAEGRVLWLLSLASPAGNRHVRRDIIDVGEPVDLAALTWQLSWSWVAPDRFRLDGQRLTGPTAITPGSRLTVHTERVSGGLDLLAATVGGSDVTCHVVPHETGVDLRCDLLPESPGRRMPIMDLGTVGIAGSLWLTGDPDASPARPTTASAADHLTVSWPDARLPLQLTGRTRIGSRAEHAAGLG
ncbi:hypothetical protein ACQBAU_13530 [Propionibacteriaceae bacterium Y2011]